MPALFNVQNPMEKAKEYMGGATSAFGAQSSGVKEPGKSVGGALMSTAGGIAAGAQAGALLGSAGTGAIAGGIMLLGGYLMS